MTDGGLPAADMPVRSPHALRAALVALVVVVGAGSAAVAWRQGDRAEQRDDAAAGQEAVDLVSALVDLAGAGLVGVSAIVPADGPLDAAPFEAFATDLLASTPLEVLALVDIVPAADREYYEAILGRPVTDRGPDGPVTAPARDPHYTVRTAVPLGDVQRVLVGFDLAGDPVRRATLEQARDTGMVVFSEPVPSQPTGTLSSFVAKALYRPGHALDTVAARRAALAGFVTSTYTSRLLLEAMEVRLPEGTAAELWDGQTLVARTRPVDGGVVRGVEVGDRTWTLLVDGPGGADRGLAAALAALTVVLGGGLAHLFRSGARHDRDVQRSTLLMARTAALAQALAGAVTVEEVAEIIEERLPRLLDLRAASLGFVDREAGAIPLRQLRPLGVVLGARYEKVPIDSALPMAEAARTGAMVVLRTKEEWRRLPVPLALLADLEAAGMEGTVATPIASGAGRVVAVLTMAWGRPLELDDALLATVSTVTEICQYALQRAMATDEAARRAAELARLAEHLAAAPDAIEVARVVTTYGRAPVEAAATSVGLIDGDVLRLHHGDSVPDEYRTNVLAPPLTEPLAVTEVARSGAPLLFESQEEYRARFPATAGPPLGARAVLPLRRGDGSTVGVVAHLWNGPRDLDEGLVSTLSTIAELAGQAIERAWLAQATAEDARHTKALAELAHGLASRTNSEAVMAFLTTGVLGPLDAFHAAVGVVEGDVIRRHFTPGRLPGEVTRSMPEATPLDVDAPLAEAVRTGQPVLLPNEDILRSAYPHLVERWRAAGFAATANLPLRDRQGMVIGALGVAWEHPVVFDADLRDRLSTVAGIAGQTLERTKLVDRVVADARRSEALAELSEVLATARTADEVATAVAEQAGSVVGAVSANVVIPDPTTGALRVHHSASTVAGVRRRLSDLALDDAVPHVDVVRDGGTLTFPDRASFAARYPHLDALMAEAGNEACAVTSLGGASGSRLGAVGFLWSHPVEFDHSVLLGLRGVAELCSHALERAQLSDAEHRLVTTLQSSVLAPLPSGPGLACAARYLPAARSVGMGGDWYEGLVLPDGRYVVVVGDVAGHGITAVGQMAQFRAVLGALARLDTPLDELFPLASSVVQGEAPIASAVVVMIDTASGELRYVAAGHPPPLLRLPEGDVVLLEDGRQPLLGVPTAPRPPGCHPFPPGATLVCYTDGLVERRGEHIDAAVARLAALLGGARTSDPEELADELLRSTDPAQAHGDDIAVAVITSMRFAAPVGG